MKKALQIHLATVFGEACQPVQSSLQPRIPMSNGQSSYYRHASGQARLQEFDGLLGYINLLDVELTRDIVIPLHVNQADIHIFYLFGTDQAIQIKDVRQDLTYTVPSGRGRYIYLPTGDYEVYMSSGNCTVVNFYFRSSIFRNGNERPFQFLHPLIEACRRQDAHSCCSIDFRAGPITMARIRHLVSKLKKRDLDNDRFIYEELNKLIKLSNTKVHQEYEHLSESTGYAQKVHDLVVVFVKDYGQDFILSDVAALLRKSLDYLSEIHKVHYG